MSFFSGGDIAGLIGGGLSFLGGRQQNDAASDEASNARWFDRANYQHRYRWQVEDMRAAGLNPVLAASQGAPGLPGAAVAQVPSNPLKDAVHSGLEAARLHAELKNMKETNSLIKAQAVASRADAALKSNSALVARNNARLTEPLANIADVTSDVSSKVSNFWDRFKRNPGRTEFPNPLKIYKRLRGN